VPENLGEPGREVNNCIAQTLTVLNLLVSLVLAAVMGVHTVLCMIAYLDERDAFNIAASLFTGSRATTATAPSRDEAFSGVSSRSRFS
jgi:hypothetical protein